MFFLINVLFFCQFYLHFLVHVMVAVLLGAGLFMTLISGAFILAFVKSSEPAECCLGSSDAGLSDFGGNKSGVPSCSTSSVIRASSSECCLGMNMQC